MMNVRGRMLGVVVGVEGSVAEIAMYSMSNQSNFLWDGKILPGPKVGALVSIHQNDIRIIASVYKENISDGKNTISSKEFDNRYSKDSINRSMKIQVKGVIENDEFTVTSQYVPMIGNEVYIVTDQELDRIYNVNSSVPHVEIGKTILEGKPVKLPIDNFFASHIAIFGNTGSGKSNTLHKLFLELFKSDFKENIVKKSQFFLIDFNGEYIGDNLFNVESDCKQIFEINTRKETSTKLPILFEYIIDADILSMLFSARPATQIPFLRNAVKKFNLNTDAENFSGMEIGLIRKIIESFKITGTEAIENWIHACGKLGVDRQKLQPFSEIAHYQKYGNQSLVIPAVNPKQELLTDGKINAVAESYFKFDEIKKELKAIYSGLSPLKQLHSFLEFEKVYVTSWKTTNIEHLNPLFKRIDSAVDSLEKVIEVTSNKTSFFKAFNIISLVNTNRELRRLIPMLLSKMIYDDHKSNKSEVIDKTVHLIVDEAHNIMNPIDNLSVDDWQDYRLSIFEEIIKEGRKFGFFVTIASQRPSDISSTITSQIHNFFIHRIVNDRDLNILENTMPTLDRYAFQMIPSLGRGEMIVTGVATNLPMLVKVEKEEKLRPNSDDVVLSTLWSK